MSCLDAVVLHVLSMYLQPHAEVLGPWPPTAYQKSMCDVHSRTSNARITFATT